jgi:hypothetical protein
MSFDSRPGLAGLEGLELKRALSKLARYCRAVSLPAHRIDDSGAVLGAFDAGASLRIGLGAAPLVDAPVDELARAWKREGRQP